MIRSIPLADSTVFSGCSIRRWKLHEMFRSSSVIRLKANPVNNLARRRKRCSKPEITCTGFSVSHIFGCRSYIAIEKSCCIRQTQVNFRSPGLGNYFRFSSNEMLAQGVAESKLGSTTSNNGESPESSSTKAKLNEILESFQTFDSDMKIGTRHRREKDEHRIAQLTTELSRLEKTLNQEIKRRIETNKSLQMVRNRDTKTMELFGSMLAMRLEGCVSSSLEMSTLAYTQHVVRPEELGGQCGLGHAVRASARSQVLPLFPLRANHPNLFDGGVACLQRLPVFVYLLMGCCSQIV